MTSINSSSGSALPYDYNAVGTAPVNDSSYSTAYEEPSYYSDGSTSYDGEAATVDESDPSLSYAAAASHASNAPIAARIATIDQLASTGIFSDEELAQIEQAGFTPEELGELYAAATEDANETTTSTASTATIDDIASLGLLSDDDLAQVEQAGYTPEQLGDLYQSMIEYVNSDEFEQDQADAQQQDASDVATVAATAASTGIAAASQPGWNDDWNDKFTKRFKELDLDSQTSMMQLSLLRASGATEAQLQQAFDATSTPEGQLALAQADKEVRAEKPDNAVEILKNSLVGAAIVGGAYKLGKSSKNVEHMLQRAAQNGKLDSATRTSARNLLKQFKAGTLATGSEGAIEAAGVLRKSTRTNWAAVHPVDRIRANAAARNLTGGIGKITRGQAMQYGLGMRWMDGTDDIVAAQNARKAAATGAEKLAGAAKGGGASASTTAKAVGTASGAVEGEAVAASRTLGKLGGAAKVLGPIGIAIGAVAGGFQVKAAMDAEGGFGKESAKATGNAVGGLVGASAGAAILGGLLAPTVVGAPIGAFVGGMIGGAIGSWVGENAGGALFDMFNGGGAAQPAPATT